MRTLVVWRCDSCGEQQQGEVNPAGDFVADVEFGRPKAVRGTGCTRCAYPFGRIVGEVDDLDAERVAQDNEDATREA